MRPKRICTAHSLGALLTAIPVPRGIRSQWNQRGRRDRMPSRWTKATWDSPWRSVVTRGKPIMAAPIALHCWMPAASRFERLKRSCSTQLSEAQLNAHPSHRCPGRPCARIARDHIRLVQWQAQSRTFENPFAHPALSHSAATIQSRRDPLALTR